MTTRPRPRLLFAALLSAMLSVALVAPAEAQPRHSFPDRIDLRVEKLQPEGITIGKKLVAYVGSLANGDIYRADLRTTGRDQRCDRERPPSAGSTRGLLYVAASRTGTARVVDSRTGDLLADYTLSTEPSFIKTMSCSPNGLRGSPTPCSPKSTGCLWAGTTM